MSELRKWVRIPGVGEQEFGVSEADCATVADWMGEKAAANLAQDCPPYRAAVLPFEMSVSPISVREFRAYWESAERRRELPSSDSDDKFWAEVWSYPWLRPDGPAVGITHAEARAFATAHGARLPRQHELELVLTLELGRRCVPLPSTEKSHEESDPSFELTMRKIHQVNAVDLLPSSTGVVGLHQLCWVLSEIDGLVQPDHGQTRFVNVIKPLGPNNRMIHAGGYLKFPAWRHYLGSERVKPMFPAISWMARRS